MSPEHLVSSRTNAYNGQSGATWKISGQVTKAAFKATITYNGTLRPGYKVTLVGKVAKDGSVSGTARSSQARRSGSPCRPGRSSRCCTTSRLPQAAQVQRHDATFRFTIPASVPGLAGTKGDREGP